MTNTMKKDEYIKENIVWALLLFLWCKNLFFRSIPRCTYLESLLILVLITLLVTGMGIFLTWKRGRNYFNLASHIILTWALFVCVAYRNVFSYRIIIIAIVAGSVSALLSMVVLFRKIKNITKRKRIIRNRIYYTLHLWRRIFALGALLLLVPIGSSMLFRGTILNADVEVVKVYGDEHCLDANIDVICDIHPDRWVGIEMQDKLKTASKIVNTEARYWGVSHEISVGTADLDEGTRAYYSENNHQIVLDIDHLENSYSYDVLESIIHEVYHAYQYELVDLYLSLDEESRNLFLFYPASQYLEEFADYENGDEDYIHYYTQLAEIDARKAGKEESLVYIQRIEAYLKSGEGKTNN